MGVDRAVPRGHVVLGVTRSTASHQFATLRPAGVIARRDEGTRRATRLRREELHERLPGLLGAVLRAAWAMPSRAPAPSWRLG
jgi:DNA-binding transcriptional ArsR family regulator